MFKKIKGSGTIEKIGMVVLAVAMVAGATVFIRTQFQAAADVDDSDFDVTE